MFVATRTNKKGEIPNSRTQEKIEHLEGLKGAVYSDEEAFEAIFEKERHGRVRCYGIPSAYAEITCQRTRLHSCGALKSMLEGESNRSKLCSQWPHMSQYLWWCLKTG
ncbi:hypothetical protein PIB30_086459 [Stylosanthes scabra]|uniref:Uncharacterized protein n=1 Tax=Stylosanthes scabra TaxID=79078 RepID=A0ABU6SUN5_9FABA|nr:hypothetical protein [Stylosanthes scabra]